MTPDVQRTERYFPTPELGACGIHYFPDVVKMKDLDGRVGNKSFRVYDCTYCGTFTKQISSNEVTLSDELKTEDLAHFRENERIRLRSRI